MAGRRLVGYVRVSSVGQEDNTSLAEQRRKIQAYCDLHGDELVQVFEEVGSGTKMHNRPQFQTALQALRSGADGIVALKLDRVARNAKDVLTLVDDILHPLNKLLVLLDLNVDTSTPIGKMILTTMAAVAALEADTIRERCTNGQKAKKQAGGYAGGQPPYGMKAVGGQLVPDEEDLAIMDLIRRHHKSGKSYYAVAKYLNANGYKTKNSKQWAGNTVRNVLERIYPAMALR